MSDKQQLYSSACKIQLADFSKWLPGSLQGCFVCFWLCFGRSPCGLPCLSPMAQHISGIHRAFLFSLLFGFAAPFLFFFLVCIFVLVIRSIHLFLEQFVILFFHLLFVFFTCLVFGKLFLKVDRYLRNLWFIRDWVDQVSLVDLLKLSLAFSIELLLVKLAILLAFFILLNRALLLKIRSLNLLFAFQF